MRRGLVSSALPSLVLLAACGTAQPGADTGKDTETQVHTEVSYETFDTVRALSTHSDVVVMGTVGDVLFRADDTGGNDVPGAGVAMVYYEVTVNRVLSDDKVDTTLVLGRLDADALGIDDQTPVRAGENLILFLDAISSTESPELSSGADALYTTVSGDNGVLDVAGETVTARSPALTGLNYPDNKSTEKLKTTVSDIQHVVTKYQ